MDLNNLDNGYFDHGEGKKYIPGLRLMQESMGFVNPILPADPTAIKKKDGIGPIYPWLVH